MNKTCTLCQKEKSLDLFSKRSSSVDGLQPWCKDCSNRNSNKRIKVELADPIKKLERYARRRSEFHDNVEWYRELKHNKPCMDCKVIHPYYVLEYDHRDPSKKKNHVSALVSQGKKAVLEEIAKCDLVCKNCHAERTHNRKRRDSRKKFF